MAWPLTGSALTKYNRLLSDLRQYGDFIFVGAPDDITWLQETIVAASDGVLRPNLDDVANRSHYWMLELSRVLGEKVVVCPECPPVTPCPPCPPASSFTTTPPGFEDEFGIFAYNDIPGLTGFVFDNTNLDGMDIQNQSTLENFSAPNLVLLDNNRYVAFIADVSLTVISFPSLTLLDSGEFSVSDGLALTDVILTALTTMDNVASVGISLNPVLISLSLPALTTLDNGSFVRANTNVLLTSFTLPALTSIDNGSFLQANNNPSLITVSLGNVTLGNGTELVFSADALTATSVNHILARAVANPAYVSGSIDLSGGTSSAPTGQGIVDKADLITRGVTVTTN